MAMAGSETAKRMMAERIGALDGLRGLMALLVLVAHYFGEVAHGFHGLAVAWIAVVMFFALSGFVVGRLILEHAGKPGFALPFYMRRACRTLPAYILWVLLLGIAGIALHGSAYADARLTFPLTSYLTFTQTLWMVAEGDVGSRWLVPTWTLTVEQQFYLVAPALLLLVPRGKLVPVLATVAGISILFRASIYWGGALPDLAALVMLPGSVDALLAGLIAAAVLRSAPEARPSTLLRATPVVLLVVAAILKLADPLGLRLFEVLGPSVVAVACGTYILSIALGAPEAARLQSSGLRFLGRVSYSLYLSHLAVLGLLHGLLLHAEPDIGTWAQLAVTLAAVPASIAVAWVSWRLVEMPFQQLGQQWSWNGGERNVPRAEAGFAALRDTWHRAARLPSWRLPAGTGLAR